MAATAKQLLRGAPPTRATGRTLPLAAVTLVSLPRSAVVRREVMMESRIKVFRKAGSCTDGSARGVTRTAPLKTAADNLCNKSHNV